MKNTAIKPYSIGPRFISETGLLWFTLLFPPKDLELLGRTAAASTSQVILSRELDHVGV